MIEDVDYSRIATPKERKWGGQKFDYSIDCAALINIGGGVFFPADGARLQRIKPGYMITVERYFPILGKINRVKRIDIAPGWLLRLGTGGILLISINQDWHRSQYTAPENEIFLKIMPVHHSRIPNPGCMRQLEIQPSAVLPRAEGVGAWLKIGVQRSGKIDG